MYQNKEKKEANLSEFTARTFDGDNTGLDVYRDTVWNLEQLIIVNRAHLITNEIINKLANDPAKNIRKDTSVYTRI